METIYSNHTVSVTELKRNFANVLLKAGDEPVAVLNHNKPEAYILSAQHYEHLLLLLEKAEDMQDAKLVKERQGGSFIDVSLGEL